jgi:hypothetical protein
VSKAPKTVLVIVLLCLKVDMLTKYDNLQQLWRRGKSLSLEIFIIVMPLMTWISIIETQITQRSSKVKVWFSV